MPIKFLYTSKIYYALSLLALVVLIGTVGFMVIEDYSLSEAFYMTIITTSTVGFGEVRELSENGRLFTSFLIIASFGIFAFAITSITKYLAEGEYSKYLKNYKVNKKTKKLKNHVIVCGYGRNGKQAVTTLIAYKQPFVIIEIKEEIIENLKNIKNYLCVEGDATDDNNLIKAGINNAKALITTLPKDSENLFVVLTARELNHDLTIVSRASDDNSDKKLKIAGANNVIMPDMVGGAHMASLVMTPDVVEFLDQISIQGSAEINLEEITFKNIPDNLKYKTIRECEIRSKTGATIIGFKSPEGNYIINPSPDLELIPDSKLFVLGTPQQIGELNKIFGLEIYN